MRKFVLNGEGDRLDAFTITNDLPGAMMLKKNSQHSFQINL